jgi:hypothetical protein
MGQRRIPICFILRISAYSSLGTDGLSTVALFESGMLIAVCRRLVSHAFACLLYEPVNHNSAHFF